MTGKRPALLKSEAGQSDFGIELLRDIRQVSGTEQTDFQQPGQTNFSKPGVRNTMRVALTGLSETWHRANSPVSSRLVAHELHAKAAEDEHSG